MKYIFILNPKAGIKKKTEDLVDQIDSYMSKSGHTYEFAYTVEAGDATRIARRAVNDGFRIIVAVGGDGTVNEVATGLINSEGQLGIIPRGSGNGVARSLNIPLTPLECLEFLLSPEITTIDVGMVNQKYFVGVSGIGYDALIGKKFQSFGVRGPIPYFFIGLSEFLKYQPQNYQLEIEGERLEKQALVIAFANTKQYGNGAVIAPQADPKDGYLDVCIVGPLSYIQATQHASLLFKGNIDKSPLYFHKKCKSVKVHMDRGTVHRAPTMHLHRDGEPDEPTNSLEVQIVEQALQVCSPL
jgi:YegS/Rv2252/BmrU family lipid kinase